MNNNVERLSRKRLLILASVLCLAVVVGVWISAFHTDRESKVEWSILQSTEWRDRENQNVSNMIFASENDYHMVAIVTQGGPAETLTPRPKADRVWILLDAKYPPYLKMLPERAQFRITAEELKSLYAYAKVNPEVDQELKKHLQ